MSGILTHGRHVDRHLERPVEHRPAEEPALEVENRVGLAAGRHQGGNVQSTSRHESAVHQCLPRAEEGWTRRLLGWEEEGSDALLRQSVQARFHTNCPVLAQAKLTHDATASASVLDRTLAQRQQEGQLGIPE